MKTVTYLRVLISLALMYVCFEYWAQYRFSLNNPHTPMGLRKNMGLHSYDAMVLKENKDLISHSGIRYKTDDFGFRIGPGAPIRMENFILLGGDSRMFGYNLDYSESVAAYMNALSSIPVHQFTFPGQSPLLFNYGLTKGEKLKQLKQNPRMIIYGYDRNDYYNDLGFEKELNVPASFARKVKLAMGGYAWNMVVLKWRTFSALANPKKKRVEEQKPVIKKKKPTKGFEITDIPLSKNGITKLNQTCQNEGIELLMLYLPRAEELYKRDTRVRDRVRRWCLDNKVRLIDAYEYFDSQILGELEPIKPLFLDHLEGIHFSAFGCKEIAKLIHEVVGDEHL